MKKKMTSGAVCIASTLLLTMVGGVTHGHQVAPMQSPEQSNQGIRISGGKLLLDGETALEGFSLIQSRFSFLFFYVPEQGLWTISAHEFDGAVEAGSFRGSEIEINLEAISLQVESSAPILSRSETPAWIKLDRSFALDAESVRFGYGGRERAPYGWQDLLDSNR